MSETQTKTQQQIDLEEWFKLQAQLEDIKTKEMTLRKKVFGEVFPTPEEGVNKCPLTDGWVLKGTHKINRSVDEALLKAKQDELIKQGIPVADLIKWKPELATKAYRDLPDDKRVIFEQILDIKVGSPALEIVKPKR